MAAQEFSRRALCVTLSMIFAIGIGMAGEVQLVWNPSENADGYRVYQGDASAAYGPPTDVIGATSTQVFGLDDCTTWYFAVTAFNENGESVHSEEVSSWPRAVPTAAGPAAVEQGQSVVVVVSGTNFRDGHAIGLSNPGLQLTGVNIDDCQQMTLSIVVAADAPVGPTDVVVTHPSGVIGIGSGLFAVVPPSAPTITDLAATNLTGTSAEITWSTDEPADSTVFFRKQGGVTYQIVTDSADVTSHSVSLTGLSPETTYEFHVSSADASDNTATTPDETFATTSSPYAYLRFEAESGDLVDPMSISNGVDAFGGAWIGTPSGGSPGSPTDPNGTADYGIGIPETDVWFLWVRMYGAAAGSNELYESVDGSVRQPISVGTFGEWTWVEGRGYHLDAGLHAVELGGLEGGARADRVLLTNDPEFEPTEEPDVDVTPPSAVAAFTATPGTDRFDLSWINPSDADLDRIVVRYRTDDHFPTGPLDGYALVDEPATPGAPGSHAHTDVASGVTYHYSAFAVDTSGNVSVAAKAVGTDAAAPPPPQNVEVN